MHEIDVNNSSVACATQYCNMKEEYLQQHEFLWLHYSENVVIPYFLDLLYSSEALGFALGLALRSGPVSRNLLWVAANA